MTYAYDFNHRGIYLEMSKNNYHIRKVITDFEIVQMKGELFDHIRKMVDQLEAATEKQQGTQTMSIPLPEDWLSKELNMATDISIEGQIVPVTAGGGGGGGGTGAGVVPMVFISGAGGGSGMGIISNITASPNKFSDVETAQIYKLKQQARDLLDNKDRNQINLFDYIPKKYVVLAGGCFTSWYHGQRPKDYDVFILKNKHHSKLIDHFNALCRVSPKRFQSTDMEYIRAHNHTAKITNVFIDNDTKVQYILTEYETRKDLIDHFDAEHCCVSYEVETDKIFVSPLALDCIENKRLMPHKQSEIAAWRESKFKARGFKRETVSV